MNKLYSVAFRRLLKGLSATEITTNNIQNVLDTNNIKPTGSYMLYRLPRHELKIFVKNPCPVQNTQTEQNKQIITSSKSLRANYSIIEQRVCEKCPHKNSCQQFAKPGKESLNSPLDLLIYMSAMDQRSNLQSNIPYRIWSSGYKLGDSIAATLEDLKQGGNQTLQYQKIRLESPSKNQQQQNELNKEQKTEKKAKKRTTQKLQLNQPMQVGFNQNQNKKSDKKHKFQYNQDKKLMRTEKGKNQQRKFSEDRQNQYRKKDFDRKRSQNRSKIQQEDDFRYQRSINKNFRSQQTRPRGNSQQRSFKRSQDTDRRYQNKWEQPNRRQSSQNSYENKRYQNENRQDRRGDRFQRKQKRFDNQKGQRKERKNDDPINKKFEKSGEVYRNTKIFEAWDEFDQNNLNKNKSSRSQKERDYKQFNQAKFQRTNIQRPNIQNQAKKQSEERRGRKVRK